jgi:hypothetical protein
MLPSSWQVRLGRVRKLRRYALLALRLCRARRLLDMFTSTNRRQRHLHKRVKP